MSGDDGSDTQAEVQKRLLDPIRDWTGWSVADRYPAEAGPEPEPSVQELVRRFRKAGHIHRLTTRRLLRNEHQRTYATATWAAWFGRERNGSFRPSGAGNLPFVPSDPFGACVAL